MSDAPKLTVVEPESLKQLPPEELLRIIMQQQILIQQLQQEIERLKGNQLSDSQTSSTPPSSDLLKKSEKPKECSSAAAEGKRKPGGQPGHLGKTRKGFGRVDRYEILRPQECPHCGSLAFVVQPVCVHVQQVAQLVERPIEIVEYQRHTCQCNYCREVHIAAWPSSIVPAQDLGVSLQALLVWLGNYGHLPYEQTSRTVAGTWRYRYRGGYPPSYESACV